MKKIIKMKINIISIISIAMVSSVFGERNFDVLLKIAVESVKQNNCGKNMIGDIDKCAKSGFDDVKDVNVDDFKPQCCAAWKIVDCWEENAQKKCKESLKEFDEAIVSMVTPINSDLCINYKKGSVKCNSGSSFKVELFSMLSIILLSFAIKYNFGA
jgi:hypothetical protein